MALFSAEGLIWAVAISLVVPRAYTIDPFHGPPQQRGCTAGLKRCLPGSHDCKAGCPVEYEIILRYLARFIPEHVEVAEVRVGVGHYSEFLASRDCRLHLVNASEALLGAAEQRLGVRI